MSAIQCHNRLIGGRRQPWQGIPSTPSSRVSSLFILLSFIAITHEKALSGTGSSIIILCQCRDIPEQIESATEYSYGSDPIPPGLRMNPTWFQTSFGVLTPFWNRYRSNKPFQSSAQLTWMVSCPGYYFEHNSFTTRWWLSFRHAQGFEWKILWCIAISSFCLLNSKFWCMTASLLGLSWNQTSVTARHMNFEVHMSVISLFGVNWPWNASKVLAFFPVRIWRQEWPTVLNFLTHSSLKHHRFTGSRIIGSNYFKNSQTVLIMGTAWHSLPSTTNRLIWLNVGILVYSLLGS